jgi:formate dehydrogenase maturation protein FdhE
MAESGSGNKIIRPDPDPSTLTTQQLQRELLALREIIEARLDGNDIAVNLLRTTTDKLPSTIKMSFEQLKSLHEEKFSSIAKQFMERDIRTEQTARDSKVAVDAALQAQKEAAGAQNESNAASISKSEAAFTKQIDQILVIVNTNTKATDEKIDDIKTRMSAYEGRRAGHGETWGYLVGGVSAMWAVMATIGLIVEFATRH